MIEPSYFAIFVEISENRAKNVLILPNYAHARACVYVYTIIKVLLSFSNT